MMSGSGRKEPFRLETAITQLPGKIDCIEINGESQLIVATNDGSLVCYNLDRTSNTMVLGPIRRGFTKKTIVQMKAIEEIGVLVVLSSDGVLTVYDLAGFNVRGLLDGAKGCNLFSVDLTNPNAIVLCAAVKKKVII